MSSEKTAMSQVSIEDDMEEDFDDLLEKFRAAPASSQATKKDDDGRSQRPQEKPSAQPSEGRTEPEIPDDFARDLAEGMEALLAGMKQEDGGEFRKHLEALVSGDGGLQGAGDLLDALNQKNDRPSSSSAAGLPEPTTSTSSPATAGPETKEFQAAIQETMEKLKRSDDSAKAKSGASAGGEEDEKLAALFEKMMAGDENGVADENQLQTILQSFMEELMSKEIMYEPLKDMSRLFPDWIRENRSKLSPDDLQRYETQSKIIQQVIDKFEDPRWDADEKTGTDSFLARQKEVIDLLTQMQDCGPPPKEILGDMPAGVFGEDGLPNPEQCLIS